VLSGTVCPYSNGDPLLIASRLFGYDMSVMGGVITEDSFLSVFPAMKNANTLGIVIATFELGDLFGALACLDISDRLGRRATVWLGMCFMLVSRYS
jgi:MFS family permease